MTSFKKYFLYRFKSSWLQLILIVAMSVIIMMASRSELDYYEKMKLNSINTVVVWLCFFVPILELSLFKNRRNMDTILSLPISRKKIALAHLLNGYIQIALPLTVCTIISLILLNSPTAENYPWQVILNYVILLPVTALVYGVFSFIFMKANTVVDGVITQALSILSIFLAGGALKHIIVEGLGIEINFIDYSVFVLFSPINLLGDWLFLEHTMELYEIIGFITICLLGLVAILGYFKAFAEQKPERIGGISDSIIGYRLLIPVYAFSLSLTGLDWFILLSAFIGYTIFRRGVKFKKGDIICMALVFMLQVALNM